MKPEVLIQIIKNAQNTANRTGFEQAIFANKDSGELSFQNINDYIRTGDKKKTILIGVAIE